MMQNPDEVIEQYQLAKKDRTMNSEAEKLFDAIADWKSNDDWQFADKEAAWKFFFQAGAASRDAEIAELVAALERMRVAGGSQEFHIAWELAKDVLDKAKKP